MEKILKSLYFSSSSTGSILSDFRVGGKEKIMVVTDFDYTLTLRQDDSGNKGCLTHEVFQTLKQKNGCTVEALQHELNKHYETALSNCSTKDDRISVQIDWWNESHDIIVRSGVHCDQLPTIVRNSKIIWRKNVLHLIKLLEEMSVPLLIYSAGITDIIKEAIRQLIGYFPCNISIVANRMHFDEHGRLSGFTMPPLCSLTKTMVRLRGLAKEVDEIYKDRTNVILIGDSDEDAIMLNGWEERVFLKIRLVQDKISQPHSFDLVILGSDCHQLIDIVKYIIFPQQT
ncbi:HAD hydrolase, family IE [Dictyocaulus viviparus]|uniref:5'-nucleotidase n=1 Tax=Dictyocaulus viviparus TaxID=29172 RepID=A0A0D8XEC2_DICVI|nr:HAD hydrolase, family IE [Dictyocaulus viviparus]